MTDYFFTFCIPYPDSAAGRRDWNKRYSLNAYYSGKHWTIRKRDAEYWHLLVLSIIGKTSVKMASVPVALEFYFNDALDCSNHGAIVKMIEDALKGRVIKDDTCKYVQGVHIGFHDKPYIKVVVRSNNNIKEEYHD